MYQTLHLRQRLCTKIMKIQPCDVHIRHWYTSHQHGVGDCRYPHTKRHSQPRNSLCDLQVRIVYIGYGQSQPRPAAEQVSSGPVFKTYLLPCGGRECQHIAAQRFLTQSYVYLRRWDWDFLCSTANIWNVIRPHRSKLKHYVRRCALLLPTRVAWFVTTVSPAKMAELIEMPFGF